MSNVTTGHWNLSHEKEFVLAVVAAFNSPGEWQSHVRERHGSVNSFLRAYIKTLDSRVLSFESSGWNCINPDLLLESERQVMREFCRRLMVTELSARGAVN